MKKNNITGNVKTGIKLKLASFVKELFGIPPREVLTFKLKEPTQEKRLSPADLQKKVQRSLSGNFVFDPFENCLPTKGNDNSMNF